MSGRIRFVRSSILESSIARDMIVVISRYKGRTIDRMRLMRIGEESGLPGPVWGGRRGGLIRG